jgi:rubrerythrin
MDEKDVRRDRETKKRSTLHRASLEGNQSDEHGKGAVLVEVRHLRRILKPRPRARKHMSEAFDRAVTEEDLKITKEVLESLSPAQGSLTDEADEDAVETFRCFQCGHEVERGSERCTKCGVRYIADPLSFAEDDAAGNDKDSSLTPDDCQKLVKDGMASCIHLDVTSGSVNYLRKEEDGPDFGLECGSCGAIIQFGADRCPACGAYLEDEGLLSMLHGLKFDLENDSQMACPSCGERVTLASGQCPKCHEIIRIRDPRSPEAGILPLVNAKNVIFVHLDVRTGEFTFVQKFVKRKTDVPEIHLDSLGSETFGDGQGWNGLGRI